MLGSYVSDMIHRPEPTLHDSPVLNVKTLRDSLLVPDVQHTEEVRQKTKIPSLYISPNGERCPVPDLEVLDELLFRPGQSPVMSHFPLVKPRHPFASFDSTSLRMKEPWIVVGEWVLSTKRICDINTNSYFDSLQRVQHEKP